MTWGTLNVTFMEKKLMNKKFARNNEDDEDSLQKDNSQLQFYTKVNRVYQHDVFIDEPFVDSSYYRTVIAMLNDAGPDDLVIFHLNSPGGLLSGLQSLVEAVKGTEAHTVAYLVGQCASAASIFSMYCDSVVVSDLASVMIHNVSYATGGKNSDIIAHTQHVAKTSEKLIRETYSGFLTSQEIEEVLNGREIYFDADEARERFAKRVEYFEEKYAEPETKPKKPSRKKKEPVQA